ncbi:EamA family transporter [Pseudomonas sp. TE50-2]|uniref:EamA family transporter n=1 Tax=Pseudomonas sp. TE50-2 TaxID=3142707 RepID=UPI00346756B6
MKLAGVLLAVSGVGLLLGMPKTGLESSSGVLGFGALITATVIGAVTSVMYSPYLARYSALHTSGLAMVAAVMFLILYCLLTSQPLLPSASAVQWANVCFIGLSSGLGYFCWLWALARLEPSRVVAFQALGPITAAGIEIVLGSRMLTLELIISLVMVITGLSLAMRMQLGKPKLSVRNPSNDHS